MTKRQEKRHFQCVECGTDLPEKRTTAMIYCSISCALSYRKKHHERYANEASYINKSKLHFFRRLASKDRLDRKKYITPEFLVQLSDNQSDLCAISGQPMTYTAGQGRVGSNASVDQIIAGQGYRYDNVQLVTCDVNRIKGNLSMEELYNLCEVILANRKDQPKRDGSDD